MGSEQHFSRSLAVGCAAGLCAVLVLGRGGDVLHVDRLARGLGTLCAQAPIGSGQHFSRSLRAHILRSSSHGERAAILPVLGCVLCVVLGQCGAVWHTWNSENMVPFTMGTLVIASASMAWKG